MRNGNGYSQTQPQVFYLGAISADSLIERKSSGLLSEDLDVNHDDLVSCVLCEQPDLLNLSVRLHSGDSSILTGQFGGANEAGIFRKFVNPTRLCKRILSYDHQRGKFLSRGNMLQVDHCLQHILLQSTQSCMDSRQAVLAQGHRTEEADTS